MPVELFANTATTTLAAAITDTVGTSITVASSAGFPVSVTGVSQFRIKIDNEIMIVTNVAGTTWTVTRGAEGSTAATHANAAPVTHALTAEVLGSLPTTGRSIVPDMWALSWRGCVASASATYGGSPGSIGAWAVFTSPSATNLAWLNNGGSTGVLQIQLPVAAVVSAYSIQAWLWDGSSGRSPGAWTFEGSNDGSTWTTLDTQTSFTAYPVTLGMALFTVSAPASYLYYRLNISNNGGGSYMGLNHFGLYT